MPTTARRHQLSRSLMYHVYNRENGKQDTFHEESDFLYFIELLKQYSDKSQIKIYHWVIMSNHYHLLIELEMPEEISSIMAGIGRSYTVYHHRQYDSSGHLWQGRFKCQAIESEQYLHGCGRYIERNPVAAMMIDSAEKYPYSSARFYVTGEPDGLTDTDPLFSRFGNSIDEQRIGYQKFLKSFNHEEDAFFENLEQPLGSREFLRRLRKEKGVYLPRRRGRPAIHV